MIELLTAHLANLLGFYVFIKYCYKNHTKNKHRKMANYYKILARI